LEGLEVSIKRFSELRETILGSDFNSIKKQNALNKIKSIYNVSDYFDLNSEIVKNLSNVLSYDLTHTLGNFLHSIEPTENIEGARKLTQHNDFIISRLRSYLKEFAVVRETKKYKQVFSTEYLVYRPKTDKISSNTLLAFCLTKEVQTILNCSQYGTEHPRFYEFVFNELPIPDILCSLNSQINNIFNTSFQKREQSQALYREAEALLLETIGLHDFHPTRENKNIKTFKESFLAMGRLDAEYYQPKYEEIIARVKQQEYDLLSNLASIKKSIEPGSDTYSDEGLPFLRVADYNKFGISPPEKNLSGSFCKDHPVLIDSLKPKKNTILFSKDGSVGTAYMLSEDADLITSGAILHLTVKSRKVLPEYLTLALNSEVVRRQAERDAGGSIILHWRMEEIENVVIPLIDIPVQRRIAALIKESFALRRESGRLLNEAKELVEREIEKG
jgi:restriction endonuclease S subunit